MHGNECDPVNMKVNVTQYTIYIGLNDPDTGDQKFDTERYVSILKSVCRSYRIPFSFHTLSGGYVYDDGMFTEENTLALTLLDAEESVVREIAKDLCAFFRQESVLITKAPSEIVVIRETLT